MDAANKNLLLILLLFSDLFICEILSEGVTKEEAKQLRDEVTQSLFSDSFSFKLDFRNSWIGICQKKLTFSMHNYLWGEFYGFSS